MSKPEEIRSGRSFALARRIGLRYVRAGSSSSLAAFMSALSIAGLAFSVALLILVLSVVNGFEREVRENVLALVPHLVVTSSEPLNAADWSDVEARLARVAEISEVEPVVASVGLVANAETSRAVVINGLDTEDEALARLGRFAVAGQVAELGAQRWGAILGASLARELGVDVGDTVDVFSPKLTPNPLATVPTFKAFQVVAITRVGSAEVDAKLVTLALPDARALLRERSPLNALHIQTRDVLLADSAGYAVRQALGPGFTTESWTATLGAMYRNIQFSRSIIGFMLWLLIAIAAFNLVVSLVMMVRDKRGDVAILITLGASARTIGGIFLWQGVAIAFIGVALGTGLGVVAALWIGELASAFERATGVVLLNPDVYPIDFLPSQILLSDLLVVASGVLVLAVLAAVYPARQAAALKPAVVLRGD